MKFEKPSDLFTALVPPLILCACIRLITYYGHWNVPILDYLTTAEILLSFVDAGLDFILLAFAYFLYTLAFVGVILAILYFESKFKKQKQATSESGPEKKSIKSYAKEYGAKVALFFVLVVLGLVFLQGIWYDFDVIPTFLLHLVLFFVVAFVVHELFTVKVDATKTQSKFFGAFSTDGAIVTTRTLYITLCVVLLSASFFHGRFQFHETETHPLTCRLMLADSTVIETDSTTLFLGKTAEYYYLSKKGQYQAKIIPASEVKEFVILKTH